MKDKPLFPTLSGTHVQPPLSAEEMDRMWHVVRNEIRKPQKKGKYWMIASLAATVLILIGLAVTIPRSRVEPPIHLASSPTTAVEPPPFIEEWEGTPSLMYEGEHDTVKVAFIVDQSVTW